MVCLITLYTVVFPCLNFRHSYWQFEVSREFPGCKLFHPPGAPNASSTCLFYFSLNCNPVPEFCPENSGICVANKIDYIGSNTTLYTMPIQIGQFKEGKNPFKSGLVELQHTCNLAESFQCSVSPCAWYMYMYLRTCVNFMLMNINWSVM